MKNNGEYHLTLLEVDRQGEGKIGKYPVIYPDTVYPFEYKGLQLFAHPVCYSDGETGKDWQVTEKATGMFVSAITDTKDRAIEEAKQRIDSANLEFVKQTINEFSYD